MPVDFSVGLVSARPALTPPGRSPRAVIFAQTARRAVRSAVLWGCVFGVYVIESARAYEASYPTAADRARFQATIGSDVSVSALIGPAHQLQTVSGFVVWRCLGELGIVGAVWGLLISTRLLRGEEDAGRWELLLAGQTTRRGAAGKALIGLGAALGALWAVTSLFTVVVGHSSTVHIAAGPSLFFALALVSNAAVFLAAGAFASQLAPTRRQAAGYAGAGLGVCYAMRMVADSGPRFQWLRWLSPLGWVEQLQPLTAPEPVALLPIVALVGALAWGTVQLAGSRDLGASALPDHSTARPRLGLLSGQLGLSVRLVGRSVIAWGAGVAGLAFIFGAASKQAGSTLSTSSSAEKVLSRLGASGSGASAYLGVTFLVVALLVALVAAGQIGAARAEEAEGRLDHLLVRAVSRSSWFAGRLVLAAGALAGVALGAGLFAWFGVASDHAGVSLGTLLAAGVNVAAPALFILGVGGLTMGFWPRATAVATYAVITWAILIELLGGFTRLNHWLLDTSLFHQMASAPAVPPDWTVGGVLTALGAVGAFLGGFAFQRRDLASE